jgi:magnesium-transporting ATPase (P-type)
MTRDSRRNDDGRSLSADHEATDDEAADHEAAERDWHAVEVAEVLSLLEVTSAGLSRNEVHRRLEQWGPNRLDDEQPDHLITVVLRQFRSPLIYILLAASAITIALGEYLDAAVIAAVLTLNAVIGFTQERKAEGAVRALRGLVVDHAVVCRDGHEWEIESHEIVPGDVVLLESGARVPADLRLIDTNSVRVDESLLTGESAPVDKSSEPVEVASVLADRSSMAYTGALVTNGRARGVVVATGASTELGKIAGTIRREEAAPTPLQMRMNRFATGIGAIVGIASVIAFVSGVALGGDVDDMFLTAVALAVAAIPEGLPVVFTVTLALGVHRMAQRHAIVRRLPAVETLGSTTVIGSDKTGTLTENRMTVQTIWAGGQWFEARNVSGVDRETRPVRGAEGVEGAVEATVADDGDALRANGSIPYEPSGFTSRAGPSSDGSHDSSDGDASSSDASSSSLHRLLVTGVLANEAEVHRSDDGFQSIGDPTEVALLLAAVGEGIEPDDVRRHHHVFAQIPFESERRYSAVICERDGIHDTHVKGAPERVVEMCQFMLTENGPVPIDRDAVLAAVHEMAGQGLRTLAMAHGESPARPHDNDHVDEPDDLVLLGLQGMMDPPRAGVREAIATCHHAGVRVVMITGDHAVTAKAIACALGIANDDDEVMTGAELATLDDRRLAEVVTEIPVFARVDPDGKLRIVRALQARDEVVAVTGDGVNDAPALKAAALGVAMGRGGTDVAREAADMVLADDNFVSIAAAVEEGRVTFDNIRKVTFFLVSTGAATIIAILLGVWMQWPLLMLPAQLLWLNLVTNGLQDVALAFEPAEEGVLDRPPRPVNEGLLSGRLWIRTVLSGAVMAAGTLVLFDWQLDRTGGDVGSAQTMALTTMVIFMAFHVGNSRSTDRSVFRVDPRSNPFLLLAAFTALVVHVAALYFPPTQYVLRVEPLDAAAWLRIVPIAVTVIVVVEIDKAIRRRLARSS